MNLSDIRALVTRPEPQAQELTDCIIKAGGSAWAMPMLSINALPETQAMRDCVLSLDQFDKIIVTSRPAVRLGHELIEQYWPQLPIHCQWFAIGGSTATELDDFNINAAFSDAGVDSEALLSLDEFKNVDGEKILIIKGVGGRGLLEERLNEAGANTQTLDVYQRTCPQYQNDELAKKLESLSINVILCGSGETLSNLGRYLPASRRTGFQLLVPSERVAQQARDMGFQQASNACGASNDVMLQALEAIAKGCERRQDKAKNGEEAQFTNSK